MSGKHRYIDGELDEIRAGIREGRPQRVLVALDRLSELEIYSDAEQALLPQALEFLYRSAPLEVFLGLTDSRHVFASDLIKVLDRHAGELDTDQIIQSARALGLPRPGRGDRLCQAIVRRDDPRFTRWLREWIDHAAREQHEGSPGFSQHAKLMSGFRYLRWMPKDGDLANAVALLAKRSDLEAHEILKDLLRHLPWPPDRHASLCLLEYFSERDDHETRALLEDCLERHAEPSSFRILLLAAYGDLEPARVVELALRDRGKDMADSLASDYVSWLTRALAELPGRGIRLDRSRIETLLSEVRCARWPSLDRAVLGEGLARAVPGFEPSSLSSRADRFRLGLVRGFEICRVEHMGCALVLPLAFGLAWLFKKGLDVLMTPAAPLAHKIEYGLIGLWIFALAITSHTHFSGHETLRGRYHLALIFWGATLLVPAGLITLRIL